MLPWNSKAPGLTRVGFKQVGPPASPCRTSATLFAVTGTTTTAISGAHSVATCARRTAQNTKSVIGESTFL